MDCRVCFDLDDDLKEKVESAGAEALRGDRSWNSVSLEFGVTRQSVKNHMEKHWSAPATPTEVALEGFDAIVAQTVEELTQQMLMAPPEAKALYAVAITNLVNVKQTKPSQQNLIASLKAIAELTGMKMEQKLMLAFAGKMFGVPPAKAAAALDDPNIVEAEVVG